MFQIFLDVARSLNRAFSVRPLLYGSLGLQQRIPQALLPDDIDVLLPEAYVTGEQWPMLKRHMENLGYVLFDLREHTFIKAGVRISYAAIEELSAFAGIDVCAIPSEHTGNADYSLLTLEDYLKVYTASSHDGYRISKKNKQDHVKIEWIKRQLLKSQSDHCIIIQKERMKLDKKALRREIGRMKRAMTAAEIEAFSAELAEKLYQTTEYTKAQSIYAYLPYNQEVRTWPILVRAKADGKRIAVPKCYGDVMKFLWLDDFSQVAEGAFTIPEPIFDEPEADDPRALVLMPGLAFDPEGHRVGYGGGFYDKYLETHPAHVLVALCYPFQLFDHLDVDAHDVPVHRVISAGDGTARSISECLG